MRSFDACQLESAILGVSVTDLNTRIVRGLTARQGSACHFFEKFRAGTYDVQLRLDWKDIDSNGHPTLDADFIDPTTGKHHHSMVKHPAHHTESTSAEDRTYCWKFGAHEVRVKVSVSWLASVAENTNASMTCNASVIRAADGGPVENS